MDFEEGIKAAAWPAHDPELYYGIAAFQRQRAAALHEAADTSWATSRNQFRRALDEDGQAGARQLAAHDENVARWRHHADQHHGPAAVVATNVGDHIAQLRYELGLLIDEGKPRYDQALQQGNSAAAVQIYAAYRAEATGIANQRAEQIAAELGNNPLAPAPPDPSGGKGGGKKTDGGNGKGDGKPGSGAAPDEGTPDASWTPDPPRPASQTPADGAGQPAKGTPDAAWSTQSPAPPVMPPMPASPLGGGGSGGGGPSSGLGGLGSMPHMPSSLSAPLSALSTNPASVAPQSLPGGTGGGGLGNLASNFQAGLASSGAAGAGAPIVGNPAGAPAQAQPLAPFTSLQPAVAAPPVTGIPATAGPVTAGPAEVPGGSSAGGAGGAGGVAGGPMMAAPPLAPYNTPGSGAATPGPAPTGPATAPSSPPPSAPSPAGGPPLLAGTGGAVASSGMAAASREENPHIITARRVLAELVHGTDASHPRTPIIWAVAVVEAASVPYIVVANSVGGGGYLPATVFLPVGVQLAVHDSRLPAGWAGDDFLGWQRPTTIIERHYERLTTAPVYGPRVLAVATNDPWPRRPRCGGAFLGVTDRELLVRGEPPVLDGAHCHRLKVTDEGLWSRLLAVAKNTKPEVWLALGAGITEAVLAAAAEGDDTNQPLAIVDDEKLWTVIKSGAAAEKDWRAWFEARSEAFDFPEVYAPQDLDSSAVSQRARMWYRHHYRADRVRELLGCWNPNQPSVGVEDLVYCALAGGFGEQVATAIGEVERSTK